MRTPGWQRGGGSGLLVALSLSLLASGLLTARVAGLGRAAAARARPGQRTGVPALRYSTYLGGRSLDEGRGIAVDHAGNAYVTGGTTSPDFPTRHALQPRYGGGEDAFVAKLSARGKLLYATYLGGRGHDEGTGIAVDHAGNAYVTGVTYSPNFPTRHALQPRFGGGHVDAFVVKLSARGQLLYATYLGGRGDDVATGIAVDHAGNAYVTGTTTSPDFPTRHAVQPRYGGGAFDAFVARLSPGGKLLYATYLGGRGDDYGSAIAVDGAGEAYVTGFTTSPDFPTRHALQLRYGGGEDDAFVARLSPGGKLLYSTYLGGTGGDEGRGIAVDGAGTAYVTGHTNSPNAPTRHALQPRYGGGAFDVYVAKLSPGGKLLYATYLGGRGGDEGLVIAVDGAGDSYVTGITDSPDFPTRHAVQSRYGGGVFDAFVARLSARGQLLYATYLGGTDEDFGAGIAADRAGTAYVTGDTASPDFPSRHALQPRFGGVVDAFVAKIGP